VPCSANEVIGFHVSTFLYNTGCATHSYDWTFGDNATGTGIAPTHAFATDGLYHVKVHVSNGSQAVDLTQDLNVNGSGVQPTTTFDFTVQTVPGVANGYKLVATSNPANAVTQWTWDYGDGEGATAGATHTHVYADGKTYTITLTSPQFPNNPPVKHSVPIQPPHRRATRH